MSTDQIATQTTSTASSALNETTTTSIDTTSTPQPVVTQTMNSFLSETLLRPSRPTPGLESSSTFPILSPPAIPHILQFDDELQNTPLSSSITQVSPANKRVFSSSTAAVQPTSPYENLQGISRLFSPLSTGTPPLFDSPATPVDPLPPPAPSSLLDRFQKSLIQMKLRSHKNLNSESALLEQDNHE